jgi:hypothetical protein
MGGKRVCIAGYLPDGTCVRPVLQIGGLTKDWLCAGNQAIICPFSLVEFEFNPPIKDRPKPHTEDNTIHSPHYVLKGMLNTQQRLELLSKIDDKIVNKIFGAEIYSGPGWYIRAGEGDRSMGTISDPKICKIYYDRKDGKLEYRVAFTDRSGSSYNLAVTDFTFRYFLDYLHFIENLDPQKIPEIIKEKLNSSQIFLRIGLGRGWKKYPERCYLQINGVYSFPDYLNGRTFKDFELSEEILEKRNQCKYSNNLEINSNSNEEDMDYIQKNKNNYEDQKKILNDIKDKYPRAYELWTDEEDSLLIKLVEEKQDLKKISDKLQRQPSAIKSRIRKSDINYRHNLDKKLTLGVNSGNENQLENKKALEQDFDLNLFEILGRLRRRLADEENVPPFEVFHDSSLKAMASQLPINLFELMNVEGVGKRKLEKYGKLFVKEIQNYCTKNNFAQSYLDARAKEINSGTSNLYSPEFDKNQADVKDRETITVQNPSLKDLKSIRENMELIKDQVASKYNESGIADLERQISCIQQQIQAKKVQVGISDLENELSDIENEYNVLLKNICPHIYTWQPDYGFGKGKHDIYQADGLKIIRRSRTVRELRASELFEKFPFLAPKIAKCTLKDASKYISDDELNAFCDRKTSYSYEVI